MESNTTVELAGLTARMEDGTLHIVGASDSDGRLGALHIA